MNDDLDIATVGGSNHPSGGVWHAWKPNYLPVDRKALNRSSKTSINQPNVSSKTLNHVTEFAYEGGSHDY